MRIRSNPSVFDEDRTYVLSSGGRRGGGWGAARVGFRPPSMTLQV